MKIRILPEPCRIDPSGGATGCQWDIQKEEKEEITEIEQEEAYANKF